MSSKMSANLVSSMSNENRHLADFVPSFWGDIFLSTPPGMDMDARTQQEYEELKQKVRRMLVTNTDKPSQKLHIIDAVKRLGVAYHFEKEIEDALEVIYDHYCNHIQIDDDEDLYTTAVRFRLLREHGFNVQCETFNKFKNEKGKFKVSLISDVKGMLELTFMTKVISLTSIVDDTYDAYATYEELEIFTKAIHRWDINCPDQLPDCMKLCYSELLKVFKDMEDLMSEQGKSYRVQLAKEAMKQVCQAYFVEAKWLHEHYMPTVEEYLSVALVSTCYPMLTIVSFVGMEDSITKETFTWAFNTPKILRASTIICRLMDDVVSHQFEQEREHVPSAVECYIKQCGVSAQEAYDEFYKRINNAWKDMNEAFLKPTVVPTSALNRILNLTRVIDLLYKDEDAYTRVGDSAKTSITALLIDPISI
ncbi:putative terpene synthase 2 [Gossypium australe]|uniref:Putative terpene synthase 2 n=1 Tax=Gossypium australe TaxID=47621 RepID=A0A5B6VUA3_9ROSI|nr:putative terpene synthase 2 [Gossypium australe]